MKKKGIILGVSVVIAGLFVGGVVMAVSPQRQVALTPAQTQALQYTVPQLTTNTNNGQIIQVTLVLQTQSQQALTTVTDSQARVNNAIIHALNNVSGTIIDQPGGTALLAKQIQTALQVVAPISRVYFSQLLIQ